MSRPTVNNLYTALERAVTDPVVGISLAHLAGDEQLSVYGTEITPGRQLNAHYHQQGDEFYQVINGRARVLLKGPHGDQYQLEISSGDIFVIPPMTIHQLINSGTEPLLMIFCCPKSHISHDRYLSDSLIID